MVQTSRWPVSRLPISNIQPFTYRDGETYLSLLNRLAEYITTQLHPNLRSTVEEMVEEMEHILADQHGKYVEGVQDFQRIHDAFMTDVNSALMALNDNAVSDLADDPGTVFGQTLRDLFAPRAEFDQLSETVLDEVETLRNTAVNIVADVTYYVNPDTGNDSNPGTADRPFQSITEAIQRSQNSVVRNGGTIDIHLAPTIFYGTDPRPILPSDNGVNLHYRFIGHDVGGHPNVPLTQFHDFNQIVFWGRNKNLELTFQDIKFVDCMSGIAMNYGVVRTHNVHAERCGTGVRNVNGVLYVKGGIFRDCDVGVVSFMVNRHEIGQQGAGTTQNGPWFYDCTTAVRLQETVTGHVDYCYFENCNVGISVNRGANVNPDGSEFYRCGTGISVVRNSSALFGDARPQVWGEGAQANDRNIRVSSGGVITGNPHWHSIGNTEMVSHRMVKHQRNNDLLVGPFNENIVNETLKTGFTNDVTAGFFPEKSILWRVTGYLVDDSIWASILCSFGLGEHAHNVRQEIQGKTGAFTFDYELMFMDRNQQLAKLTTLIDGEPPMVSVDRWDVNTSLDQQARISLRSNNEGSIRIHSRQAWVRGV